MSVTVAAEVLLLTRPINITSAVHSRAYSNVPWRWLSRQGQSEAPGRAATPALRGGSESHQLSREHQYTQTIYGHGTGFQHCGLLLFNHGNDAILGLMCYIS